MYMRGFFAGADSKDRASMTEEDLDKGLALYLRAMSDVIFDGGSQNMIMSQVEWYRSRGKYEKASCCA
jgi:hypothetical protein